MPSDKLLTWLLARLIQAFALPSGGEVDPQAEASNRLGPATDEVS